MKLLLCSNISLLSHGIVLNWNAQKKQFNGIFYDWKNIAKNEEKRVDGGREKESFTNVIQYERKKKRWKKKAVRKNEEWRIFL